MNPPPCKMVNNDMARCCSFLDCWNYFIKEDIGVKNWCDFVLERKLRIFDSIDDNSKDILKNDYLFLSNHFLILL